MDEVKNSLFAASGSGDGLSPPPRDLQPQWPADDDDGAPLGYESAWLTEPLPVDVRSSPRAFR